ncbi:hypothetical protein GXP70_18265 [Paenibacillus lycopersici]|uniref:YozE SAM-like domain-containing protein n=1 Tax=Paenibacillus lycopersici TaxID=2704462 RepID=A0A6C0FYH9_9BACL|nr:hypothetical protein GXP70_18265 [Paenibacillus lycopersici]
MPTPIPWTFKTWIACFKGVDLPIGDLADDILRDSSFPDEDDFGLILEHLSTKSKGNSNVLETFALVWSFYQVSK